MSFRPPLPWIGDFLQSFRGEYWLKYISVIIPMGLFNLIGSLQNIESAEAAGARKAANSAPAIPTTTLSSKARCT